MKKLLIWLGLLTLPSLGFCGTLTLAGSGTGSLVINSTSTPSAVRFNGGIGNSFFGVNAGTSNVTGIENTGLGYLALMDNTSDFNTAVGGVALEFNTLGASNTAVGVGALVENTTGYNNTALGALGGWGSLSNHATVVDNNMTFLGAFASRTDAVSKLVTMTNGTAIGAFAKVTTSNTIQMGGTGAFAARTSMTTAIVSSNTVLPSATFYANAPILISTYIAFSPTNLGIKGTISADNADVGVVGEYFSSTTVSTLNCPASGNYFDLGSVTLTAGDWDITVISGFFRNAATASAIEAGVGTAGGNSGTGLVLDDSSVRGVAPTATTSDEVYLSVPNVRKSISATTTFYNKAKCTYSVGTLQTEGSRISARRVR